MGCIYSSHMVDIWPKKVTASARLSLHAGKSCSETRLITSMMRSSSSNVTIVRVLRFIPLVVNRYWKVLKLKSDIFGTRRRVMLSAPCAVKARWRLRNAFEVFWSLSNELLDRITQRWLRTHFHVTNVVIISHLWFMGKFMCYET